MTSSHPKKLIEVSIPLKEINEACAKEKSIRHGHPSTLHLWWARRPLAAARAVLFCQLVDDPSGYADELVKDKARAKITEQELLMEPEGEKDLSPRLRERLVEKERERLHDMVRKLVIWENTTNESLFKQARQEILKSWQRHLKLEGKPPNTPMPPVLDPFAGGGTIPLEAQRLGMEAHASDLNPVAVLINKAMIEIPPKFAGLPPVNPDWQNKTKEEKAANTWKGAQGLAADVRYYGNWMREEAKKRIRHLYPPYTLTQELIDARPDLKRSGYKAGDELIVIAWLWARTVPSPNPALQGKPVPLVSSFWLSKKKGKEAYVETVVENGNYRFEIRVGKPKNAAAVEAGTKTGRGANFGCLISGIPIGDQHVKEAGRNGKMGADMMAVVCEGARGRVYLAPDEVQKNAAASATPTWEPNEELNHEPRAIWTPSYGLKTYGDLFTPRQLVALTTFSDLVGEARERILTDAQTAGHLSDDDFSLEQSGIGPQAYADAVAVYLGFCIDKLTLTNTTLATWQKSPDRLTQAFGRQGIPMTWDYAEANPISDAGGGFSITPVAVEKVLLRLPINSPVASVRQRNAALATHLQSPVISTDPPYYDNIGYADLSDYFYVWQRKTIGRILPSLFQTVLVPKQEELIASPYRHGSKDKAEDFFLSGMKQVMTRLASDGSADFPTTIYYAFKQSEANADGISSTGWATFLQAILESGFSVCGTWPMRTELIGSLKKTVNALASSIVMVCRHRQLAAETITKREFIEALESELPEALRELQQANLSPVDLPQSAIGPGMAIFSRYAAVVKGDGQPMTVTEALQLINHELGHLLDGQISDMDAHTRFACKWFAQHGFSAAPYGDAELIATATDVSVQGVVASGILESGKGRVRLLKPAELPGGWNPQNDTHLTVWEVVHHLIRLAESGGDGDCAKVIAALSHSQIAEARQLAYRLFTLCDQQKWSELAQPYNQLVTNWQDYSDLAAQLPAAAAKPVQASFDL
jgi:putative DNA methylase